MDIKGPVWNTILLNGEALKLSIIEIFKHLVSTEAFAKYIVASTCFLLHITAPLFKESILTIIVKDNKLL